MFRLKPGLQRLASLLSDVDPVADRLQHEVKRRRRFLAACRAGLPLQLSDSEEVGAFRYDVTTRVTDGELVVGLIALVIGKKIQESLILIDA